MNKCKKILHTVCCNLQHHDLNAWEIFRAYLALRAHPIRLSHTVIVLVLWIASTKGDCPPSPSRRSSSTITTPRDAKIVDEK
jgi:hypothetical protein